LNTTKLSWYME